MQRLHGRLREGHRLPAPTGAPVDAARAALSTSERMIPIPSSDPRIASLARSGWGIRPATFPAALRTPAIARSEPLGLAAPVRSRDRAGRVHVPEQDLAVALERVERGLVGVVAALAVGDRHAQRPSDLEAVGEAGVGPLRGDPHLLAGEPKRLVAQQRARHEPGLGEHLEPVADAEDEAALGREGRDGPHDRAEPGDDARAEVVPVREATGQDHRRHALERRLLVPEHDRLGPDEVERRDRVAIAVAAREDDDADADAHQSDPLAAPTSDDAAPIDSIAYASMSGFDSSSEASRSTMARAARLVVRIDRQLDAAPDAHGAHALDPEVAEAALDRATLGIEDARLGGDVHGEPVAGHGAMTSSWR